MTTEIDRPEALVSRSRSHAVGLFVGRRKTSRNRKRVTFSPSGWSGSPF
jgi:hypothetical protein